MAGVGQVLSAFADMDYWRARRARLPRRSEDGASRDVAAGRRWSGAWRHPCRAAGGARVCPGRGSVHTGRLMCDGIREIQHFTSEWIAEKRCYEWRCGRLPTCYHRQVDARWVGAVAIDPHPGCAARQDRKVTCIRAGDGDPDPVPGLEKV